MTPNQIETTAQSLFEAEQMGVQCGLISLANPDMTLEDAYAVQAAFVARKKATGARGIGWKIGLTSRAMQQALDITTPDSGVLLDDMLFQTGDTVPPGRFIQPRIEAEIAFVMKSPISGADVTREGVIAAVDYVAPALEILDTRVLRTDPATGTPRIIYDTVADNAANAGVVMGRAQHDVADHDLRRVGVILKRDGVVEETGLGAGVLDDPVTGIVWLVQRLAQYGLGISPGDIVLSGSFVRPVEATPGSRFDADFGPFGQVDLTFG